MWVFKLFILNKYSLLLHHEPSRSSVPVGVKETGLLGTNGLQENGLQQFSVACSTDHQRCVRWH